MTTADAPRKTEPLIGHWPLVTGHCFSQFPSNGKVHLDFSSSPEWSSRGQGFQFPSNGKVHLDVAILGSAVLLGIRFNSLQTGRYIWTLRLLVGRKARGTKFQFPSNGKVHLDEEAEQAQNGIFEGFQFPSNGKVHLDMGIKPMGLDIDPSFNSLQTGRYIWTQRPEFIKAMVASVSIPFKREGTSGLGRKNPPRRIIRVSIPFKREGTSGLRTSPVQNLGNRRFNSLQTGRYIWTIAIIIVCAGCGSV